MAKTIPKIIDLIQLSIYFTRGGISLLKIGISDLYLQKIISNVRSNQNLHKQSA